MIPINQFKCKIGKYDLTCELNGNDIGFRVQSMSDILLYQGFYNNDTLPYQCKAYFNHSVARLYNYIKDKPASKLRFNHCELIVTFQLIGQLKHLSLYMEQKQLGSNDFIMMIQRLNQNNQELKQQNAVLSKEKVHQPNSNDFNTIQKLNKTIQQLKGKISQLQREKRHQPNTNDLITTIQKLNHTIQQLKQKNNILTKQKKYLDQKYGLLKDVKQKQQHQQRQKIVDHLQKINNLESLLKVKVNVNAKQNQLVQSGSSKVNNNKKKKKSQYQSESEYQYSEDQDNNNKDDQKHLKITTKNKPLQNTSSIKDQFVIVWKQKKDITDKIQHLSRFPDCLTVKISGKQGENGNQGIKELSQILPRIQQLKNILTLNLYFNNHQFGKGVSTTFWEVLRAAIIAHLKIKYFNIIVGPKTFKQNQKILQKQMEQYPKKITVSLQIQGWK